MKNILVVAITALTLTILFVSFKPTAIESNQIYGEYTAEKAVTAKFVQLKPLHIKDFNYKDITIETLGYSEIRVYANLFNNDYKSNPLQPEGILKLNFSHEMSGFGVPYKSNEYKQQATSYIDGFAAEKIFGRKTKLAIDADNIPKSDYTLHISYYLLP